MGLAHRAPPWLNAFHMCRGLGKENIGVDLEETKTLHMGNISATEIYRFHMNFSFLLLNRKDV